jgi:hypothetical protein
VGVRVTEEQKEEKITKVCEIIGRLILWLNALDMQLNKITIVALHLAKSAMLEPVVATLDVNRKIEILRARSNKISNVTWQKKLQSYLKAVEKVNATRNIAAHSSIVFENDEAVLFSNAFSKLIKSIDLNKNIVSRTSIADLGIAIETAKKCFADGELVAQNFTRLQNQVSSRGQSDSP